MTGATCEAQRSRGRPPVLGTEERRARVLDALDAVFARDGMRGITMTAIAAEAAMSKRTLYALFRDRNSLLLAYMERVHSAYVHDLAPTEHALPLAARLRRLLEPRPVGPGSGLPIAVLRLAVASTDAQPDLARVFFSRALLSSRRLIRAELDRAVARREAAIADTEAMATLLQGMVCVPLIDLLLAPHRPPTARDVTARFELGLATFLRGIGIAEGGARRPEPTG